MRNLFPLKEHQKLLNIWKDVRPDKNSKEYWEQVVNASKVAKEYFLNLNSSHIFNNEPLKQLNYDKVKHLLQKELLDQSVDVKKIIGHTGHIKISDALYNWRDILSNKLKCQTICHLIDSTILCDKLYYDIYIQNIQFTKFEGEYYFGSSDGLHRVVLAKYILSHNQDNFFHGVKVVNYV
jgi:hypothetical protein